MSSRTATSCCSGSMYSRGKVLVGMSGGVDSTVAAYLLREQGYEVIGAKLLLWQDDSGKKDGAEERDAELVCGKLGIEYLEIDRRTEFKTRIVDYFTATYQKGETPNPCVLCNRTVKFASLLEAADAVGAHYVATGHYAKVVRCEKTGRFELHRSPSMKDQTYALSQLTQQQLARTLMPLGDFQSKDETRRIAARIDLRISSKSDSQEICFIPNNDYLDFLRRSGVGGQKGAIRFEGALVGEHAGIEAFTIGQRKGLGVTFGKPVYVIGIDAEKRTVTLGSGDELMSGELICGGANFIAVSGVDPGETVRCFAKIRYSAPPTLCSLSRLGADRFRVVFDAPQRAITPGQTVVFYTLPGPVRSLEASDASAAISVLGGATILGDTGRRVVKKNVGETFFNT